MLTLEVIALLVGIATGYLAGLGVGGGSLLILWLTLVLKTEPATARTINLMFFLAAAGCVSIFRFRQRKIHLKKILPAVLAGCVCAAILTRFSTAWDPELLRKIFGVVLLVTGIRELFYRPEKFR